MKMNKKAVTVMSFVLGALIFTTTAFADVALGSGYDKLKESMKRTASQMNKDVKNYTFEALYSLKDNGKVLRQNSTFTKTDNEKPASEETSESQYINGKTESRYFYRDMQCNISRNNESGDKYYYSEYSGRFKATKPEFPDPFKKKESGDIEKLFDAFVGNLKNYVQVEERAEGGKKYSGSLSEEQVPALANAATSYFLKKMIRDEAFRYDYDSAPIPKMESDIVIKNISGTAVENKAGLLESLQAEAVFSGKDEKGLLHELTINIAMKVSDIDKTVVSKPDLSGKEVEKVSNGLVFDSRYLGKYKNDIVMLKDGKFVKIGERLIEITQSDDKKVAGRYYETYKPGYEKYNESKYDFNFEFNPEDFNNFITYTNASGKKETGSFHAGGIGTLWIDLNIEIIGDNGYRSKSRNTNSISYTNEFYKVFDD